MLKDVFISHASEDKSAIARPLADSLINAGLSVWLDEYEITLGDSLHRRIEDGLINSKFGIVILSKSFFQKDWTEKELSALVSRETKAEKIILPIWHEIDIDYIKEHGALLVDKYALKSSEGLPKLTEAIMRAIGVASRKGTISIFSYNYFKYSDRVEDIELKNLTHLELFCSKDDGNFEINSRSLKNFDKNKHSAQWLNFADKIWTPSVKILNTFIGCSDNSIQPSRWRMSNYGYSLMRHFNAPTWKDLPWKYFSILIHIRDSFITQRSIDNDFIDLFVTFYPDPYGEGKAIDNDEEILNMLTILKPQLTDALSGIAKVIIDDNNIVVKTSDPIWEEECIPVWGANGYWLKGILT
jgi:TIR domain